MHNLIADMESHKQRAAGFQDPPKLLQHGDNLGPGNVDDRVKRRDAREGLVGNFGRSHIALPEFHPRVELAGAVNHRV